MELAAYRLPNDTDTTNWHALTTWMAFIPTDRVEKMRSIYRDTSSSLYQDYTMQIQQQLADLIDPNFDILSGAGLTKSAQYNAVVSKEADRDKTVRSALISVSVALVGVLLILFVYTFWRNKRAAKQREIAAATGVANRANTIRSAGGLRETWAPSEAEQERVMGDIWSMSDRDMSERVMSPEQGFHSAHNDPFSDPSQGQQAAEASAAVWNNRLASRSLASLTPSQRIQLEYQEQHGLAYSAAPRASFKVPPTAEFQGTYTTPTQHTEKHAYANDAALYAHDGSGSTSPDHRSAVI